ncbi:MAG: AraC family transcriptional regulator [Clostridia bacterium]|nr:AraC family transcriptional regulator [Clostridia bacterium]
MQEPAANTYDLSAVIAYIEDHLCDDKPGVLDNAALAGTAGYSPYHFLRIFRRVTGMTPAHYIRRRRLTEIVKHMAHGIPLSETAFRYGFNSGENFTRAFRAEHGILPTEFRAAQCSLRLWEPFSRETEQPRPVVSLCHRNPFSVTAYPCDEDFPPRFWNRYNASGMSRTLSGGETVPDWGVMRYEAEKGRLAYYIGIRSECARGDTRGTVSVTMDGGLYAIFDTPPATPHDFVATIHRTWDYIADVWLPENGFARTGGYEAETYIEQSRTYSERIYIPVKTLL